MSALDISEEIRTHLPGTEEVVVQYVSDYLVDDAAADDDDALAVARAILDSAARGRADAVERLMGRLGTMLADTLRAHAEGKQRPTLTKLDKVVEMGKAAGMSGTLAFSEAVDLESVNKGKCVHLALCTIEPC
jgi:ATP-binding cassette, subfamily F, member 3